MDETPTDPNDLVRAIMEAGLYGQRLQPLQQRYALGQQFMDTPAARGANVGSTYVAASPLEHLANTVRQLVGAKMASSAMQGQRDLTGQLASGRQAYAQALQNMGGKTVAGDYGEPVPGVGADPQGMNRLAMLGALSGDPGTQLASQTALQEQHYQTEQQRVQNTADYQRLLLGLKGAEQKTLLDPYGNPITVKTHATGGPLGAFGGGGGSPRQGPPKQAAVDQAAQQFAISGSYQKMPGRAGAGFDSAVRDRVAELYPDASFASNKADYVANTNSLRKMQAMSDSIDTFENTALKNSRMLLDTAKGIVDTGSPLFNKPMRYIQQKLAGDPRMTQFNAARQVAGQEIGKVLGGAVAGGVVTDSQRHEVDSLLSGDMTIPQMEATIQTLEADMVNRKAATQAGLDAIRSRMSGKGAKGGGGVPAAIPQAPTDTTALRKKYGL